MQEADEQTDPLPSSVRRHDTLDPWGEGEDTLDAQGATGYGASTPERQQAIDSRRDSVPASPRVPIAPPTPRTKGGKGGVFYRFWDVPTDASPNRGSAGGGGGKGGAQTARARFGILSPKS